MDQITDTKRDLLQAIEIGSVSRVELALTNGSIDALSFKNGWSLLHYAAMYGQESILSLLLRNKIKVEEKCLTLAYRNMTSLPRSAIISGKNCETYYTTPLHLAAENGNAVVVDMLLKHGENIDSINARCQTPLFIAAYFQKKEVVSVLLNRGASTSVINSFGDTPLHVAARNGEEEITLQLIHKSAETELKNKDKHTPLLVATQNGREGVVNVLLQAEANVNAVDLYGNSSLHLACEAGFINIVKLLLHAGADVNVQNMNGWTPLLFAVYCCKPAVVKQLLDHGVDVTLTDHFRNTVLHICMVRGDQLTAELLLKRGMDINSKNCDELSPIDLAKRFDRMKFFRHWIEHTLCSNINEHKPTSVSCTNLSKYWDSCKSELELMEDCKIANSNLSYLKLLIEKNRSKLAAYLCNGDIVREFDKREYIHRFPIYSQYIAEKIVDGAFRAYLYFKADQIMHRINPFLPRVVQRKLYNYLSDDDLANLVDWDLAKVQEICTDFRSRFVLTGN